MDRRGKGASTGERQRICIARLLLRESPIMILDEPWSNLDDRARKLLAEVINACKSTATILILTHERHPALAVDRLYRLDGALGPESKRTPLPPMKRVLRGYLLRCGT